MVDTPTIYTRTTEYQVSVFPHSMANSDDLPTAEAAQVWSLTVAWRGQDRWAILRGPFCLGADGQWSYELRPSERGEDWLTTHRFDLETALKLAAERQGRLREILLVEEN